MEKRKVEEASAFCGIPPHEIIYFIEQEWIFPVEEYYLDAEDIARLNLIWELRTEFGVNDESMPIILNLLDQLNRLHLELERFQVH